MARLRELSVRSDKNEYVKACFYAWLFLKNRGFDAGFLLDEVRIYADHTDDAFIRAWVGKGEFKGRDLVGVVKEIALYGESVDKWLKLYFLMRRATNEEKGWALVWIKALGVKCDDWDKRVEELMKKGELSDRLMFVLTNNSKFLKSIDDLRRDYELWLVCGGEG